MKMRKLHSKARIILRTKINMTLWQHTNKNKKTNIVFFSIADFRSDQTLKTVLQFLTYCRLFNGYLCDYKNNI